MAISAETIIDAAGVILNDTGHNRWTEDELLSDLNDGEKAIVLLKPDAYVVSTTFQLVAGVFQSIPSGGIQFIGTPTNMGTGAVQGSSIPKVDKEVMDTHNPDWPTNDASATVNAIMYDPADSKHFYCTPPQPSSNMGYIRWPYSANPTDIAAKGDNINLDDVFKEPLIQWLLYKSYSRDAEHADNPTLADKAEARFYKLLGIKDQKEVTEGPK